MTRGSAGSADDWGLHVNEIGIFATRIAEGKWLDFLARARDERVTMLDLTPTGSEWHVMCGTRDAAREAHEIFLEAGFHKRHIRVARLSACQAKAAERRQRVAAVFATTEAERAERDALNEAWSWWVANVMPDKTKDRQAAQDAYWAIVTGGGKAEALRQYREHLAQGEAAA